MLPLALTLWPKLAGVQEPWPPVAVNSPGGHRVHAVAPALEKLPAAQAVSAGAPAAATK